MPFFCLPLKICCGHAFALSFTAAHNKKKLNHFIIQVTQTSFEKILTILKWTYRFVKKSKKKSACARWISPFRWPHCFPSHSDVWKVKNIIQRRVKITRSVCVWGFRSQTENWAITFECVFGLNSFWWWMCMRLGFSFFFFLPAHAQRSRENWGKGQKRRLEENRQKLMLVIDQSGSFSECVSLWCEVARAFTHFALKSISDARTHFSPFPGGAQRSKLFLSQSISCELSRTTRREISAT
jgi:hypothetical protein